MLYGFRVEGITDGCSGREEEELIAEGWRRAQGYSGGVERQMGGWVDGWMGLGGWLVGWMDGWD